MRAFVRSHAFIDHGVVPRLEFVPARLRRGLSSHQRFVLHALGEVVPEASRSSIAIVHGSTLAEVGTAVALATSDVASPARFATSVHNAAIGIFSIATDNRVGHVTLSAGGDTLIACFVEALGRLAEGAAEVAIVVADESDPRLLRDSDEAPFALAVLLSSESEGASHMLELLVDDVPTTALGVSRPSALHERFVARVGVDTVVSRSGRYPAVRLTARPR